MLKNYFTIAWRNLWRNKGYATINIAGLSIGMACCLLITLYILDELSYDQYHVNKNRIYRVIHEWKGVEGTGFQGQVWGNVLS
ncbi:ABC transporter permease [Olivibacter sp. XZL3]|uniref:ABC transporter permease n=1 Tax=Olivibacter sp. XZL3 TaxID=1735116 RepID=UPI001065C335|nr:ABC transporter permease [Olivibacter sp. XZL3]